MVTTDDTSVNASTTDPEPLLRVRNLCVSREGRHVVDDLSLTVGHQEVVGLIGDRGAGKRAALEAIVGETEKSGSVQWRGMDVSRSTARQLQRLGLVSTLQRPPRLERARDAFWEPSVHALISRGLAMRGELVDRKLPDARVIHAMRSVCLPDSISGNTLRTLSGGTILRVQLARLLAASPQLIVLDEPLTGR